MVDPVPALTETSVSASTRSPEDHSGATRQARAEGGEHSDPEAVWEAIYRSGTNSMPCFLQSLIPSSPHVLDADISQH